MNHLLFDKYHVSNHGLIWGAHGDFSVKANKPKKSEPFFVSDRPWEELTLNWLTIKNDGGLWRMWYEAFDKTMQRDFDGRLCYAESRDGITWEKPELGLREYNGNRRNNILLDKASTNGMGIHGSCIFKDPTAPDCARWRMVFLGELPPFGGHAEWPLVCYAYSSDGLDWHMGAPEMQIDFNHHSIQNFGSDTQCSVDWDPDCRKYVGYFRTWEKNGARSIARSETNELMSWPTPRAIIKPDFRDPFETDYYNSAATRYTSGGDTARFIFTSAFDHKEDTLYVRLLTGRDGVAYDQYDRSPYLLNDSPFDRGGIYVSPGIHDLSPEKQFIAYSGVSRCHDAKKDDIKHDGHYIRAEFAHDRLQGLDTSGAFEFCVMGKLDPHKPEVRINADVRGRLRGGLIAGGKFLPGFSPDDCEPVHGDSLCHRLSWRGGETTATEADLKIFMEDATIYAAEF